MSITFFNMRRRAAAAAAKAKAEAEAKKTAAPVVEEAPAEEAPKKSRKKEG